MSKPIVRIQNAETGEVIDREMTENEFKSHQAEMAFNESRQAEADGKATAKAAAQAKLAALGLTVEDLQALGL